MAEQAERKGEASGYRLLVAEAIFEKGHAYRNLNELNKAKELFVDARRRFAAGGRSLGGGLRSGWE
jgi:hypothetical protein